MKKHRLIIFIVHFVFWCIASYLFLNNSFIRPYSSILLESVVLVNIILSFYLSYFVLLPKLLMRRCLLLFFHIQRPSCSIEHYDRNQYSGKQH